MIPYARIGLAAAIVMCMTLHVGESHAASNKRMSKKHFRAAEVHYSAGRFNEALDEYTKAFEYKPLPAFLFNIGQCHMELENYERALFYFESYLRKKLSSRTRRLVEERMTAAQRAIREQDRARVVASEPATPGDQPVPSEETGVGGAGDSDTAAAPPPPDATAVGPTEAADNQSPGSGDAAATSTATAPPNIETGMTPTSPPDSSPAPAGAVYETWWFWTLVGGAVLAAAGGTALALTMGGETTTVLPSGELGTIDAR